MQVWRHGSPQVIRSDNEYNNEEFGAFCLEYGINLLPVAADDHEANGLIENSYRTLRSFFKLLLLCDKRSTCESIVNETLYCKNISCGFKEA